MKITEITTVKPVKPLTPAQARINLLTKTAERAKDAVKRERDLQKQQKARDTLQRLQRPASIKT
jgi:hypothetical protein